MSSLSHSAPCPVSSSFVFTTLLLLKVRCWTILQGTLAPQAAGVIHSDFERGFIKAEVVSFDDFKR